MVPLKIIISLFLAALCLLGAHGLSLLVARGGYTLVVAHGLLIGEAALVGERWLWGMSASVVVAPRL